MASYKDASPKATLRLLQENLPRISQNISLSINTERSSLYNYSKGSLHGYYTMHLRRGNYQVNGVTHPFPNGITVSSAPIIWSLQNIVKLWSFYVDTDHLATGHARGELNCFS